MISDYRFYEVIDSTNTEAKRIIERENPSAPVLLVARSQTAGRGRQGKSFYSPADSGLYMTLIYPAGIQISGQVTITTRTAVAVARAIEETYGIEPGIKWVNDLYHNGKKICGILCEAVNDYSAGIMKYAVIGVGVNISTTDFPDELKNIAGSITGEKPSDNYPLAEKIALNIINIFKDSDFMNYYKKHSIVLGKKILITEGEKTFSATAVDIDENGGLITEITGSDGVKTIKILTSGEISLRIN